MSSGIPPSRKRRRAVAGESKVEVKSAANEEPLRMESYFSRKQIQEALLLPNESHHSAYNQDSVTLQAKLLDTIGTVSALWLKSRLLEPLKQHNTGAITIDDVQGLIHSAQTNDDDNTRDPVLHSLDPENLRFAESRKKTPKAKPKNSGKKAKAKDTFEQHNDLYVQQEPADEYNLPPKDPEFVIEDDEDYD